MIRLSLRIPVGLPERVTARAAADRRSLNSEILHPLEAALAAPRVDAGPPGGDPASPAPLRGKPDSSPA
ncbi:Arc family DNA-binding protein [Streptomyces sp. NPDC059837]|uniref:Arc family DNA-binding protein n=1 Tax=unclassified Streptomyces TaxID=2593676 RepID=UPI0022514342|nr:MULTISPECIES: Arc family DNA-binding protein [unclassified Streptomyces]MCX4408981.1 Arc family DNA-binding protein [Streptomyces sp. NBC_01764]MCX5091137.1 Arc family DNA-binding protein [Streptomyces sp. NBC_00365]MCX5185495.1 Arc family DNA-binding protein [Streptomyces sp. NBC_00268]